MSLQFYLSHSSSSFLSFNIAYIALRTLLGLITNTTITHNTIGNCSPPCRLLVSQAGRALHLVTKDQFLDSPEWFGVTTDEIFQVGTRATW